MAVSTNYALVTGASQGIGRALAGQLALRGHNLILVARNEQALAQASHEITTTYPEVKAIPFVLDLSEAQAPQQLFDWCTANGYTVDILVNNAGYGLSGPFEQHALAEHENMMALNMQTVVRLCYRFLPMLKQQPRSYILNVASTAAYQATPFLGLYSATKSFVLLFSRALHRELKGSAVSVTCVCPGATDTAFVDRAQVGDKARKLARKVHMTPAKVARMAVAGMFARKPEVVTGAINKLGVFIAWLLPKSTVENSAAKIYQ